MTDTPKAYTQCPICRGEHNPSLMPCPRCNDQGVIAVHNDHLSIPYGWQITPPHLWS